jgi:type IV pilus assembly protein PilB
VERREISGTMHLVVAMTDPTNLMVTDSLQFMTGCRIKAALASDDAISAAIDKNYGPEVDDQEELDFALEDLAEVPKPVAPQPVAPPAPVTPPTPVARPVSTSHNDGFSASALKQLENRYENLVRILLDRGVIDNNDLDELM